MDCVLLFVAEEMSEEIVRIVRRELEQSELVTCKFNTHLSHSSQWSTRGLSQVTILIFILFYSNQ